MFAGITLFRIFISRDRKTLDHVSPHYRLLTLFDQADIGSSVKYDGLVKNGTTSYGRSGTNSCY